jgi:DMSO/TMAO reductase YedYZ molybdopterin-dependent catalytic subunit
VTKLNASSLSLPPGQKETQEFSRYGLSQYAKRIPLPPEEVEMRVYGDVASELTLRKTLFDRLSRVDQVSDFHCITTWSKKNVQWSGYRFKDFYQKIILKDAIPDKQVKYVIFRSRDNYRTYFLLEDLLTDDVLLADTLYGEPLSWQHGAPMRLVAPKHYGFRSAKHLKSIEFSKSLEGYRSPTMHWTEHPRARVEYEERGKFLPGIIYRYLFRPVIPLVRWWYRKAEKDASRQQ